MNAKEARAKALSSMSPETTGALANIRNAIRGAANNGKLYIIDNIHGSADAEKIKHELEKDGYTVKIVDDQRDGMSIRVDW